VPESPRSASIVQPEMTVKTLTVADSPFEGEGHTAYGYGGLGGTTCSTGSHEVHKQSKQIPVGKANWSRAKCLPRMTNVFIQMREEFMLRDKRLPRFMIDAKDHDWFWRKAADAFNRSDDDALNFNVLQNESYPEEVKSLDPYYREGYVTTASKLKAEFRDLRSAFMKCFANFQKSGMGEKDNVEEESDAEGVNEQAYVFSSNFFDFCKGDMCMYYFYCCATKFGLLKSAVVTMPVNSRHDGATVSKLSVPSSNSSKRDAGLMKIGEALSAPIEIRLSKEQKELNRFKRQKYESDTYKALNSEYIELYQQTESGNIPSFLMKTNKDRMKRLEEQLHLLAQASQNVTPDSNVPDGE